MYSIQGSLARYSSNGGKGTNTYVPYALIRNHIPGCVGRMRSPISIYHCSMINKMLGRTIFSSQKK